MRTSERNYSQALMEDEDRKAPEHDELIYELSSDILNVLRQLFGTKVQVGFDRQMDEWKSSRLMAGPPEPVEEIICEPSLWNCLVPQFEHPVTRTGGRGEIYGMIGFLDMFVQDVTVPSLALSLLQRIREQKAVIRYPARTVEDYYGPGMSCTFPAELADFRSTTYGEPHLYRPVLGTTSLGHSVAFEIKVKIERLSDVIRQIKLHRQFLPSNCAFVLVSPDTRYRDIIESQDILFYEPRTTAHA